VAREARARAAETAAETAPAALTQARPFGERFCASITCGDEALCALKRISVSFRSPGPGSNLGCTEISPPPTGTPAGIIPFSGAGRVTAVQCDCEKCAREHKVPLSGVTVGGVNTPNTLTAIVPADTAREAVTKFERLADPALKAAAEKIVKAFCEA